MLMFRTIKDLRRHLEEQKARFEEMKERTDRAWTPADRSHAAGAAYGLDIALLALEGLLPHVPAPREGVADAR